MTQAEAFEILKTGKSVFLTGQAGSGKTHLLNQYIAYMREHGGDVAVTASTGIAATHMGGMTIHSWSGLGVSLALTEHDIYELVSRSHLKSRFATVDTLIIDEISMLHAVQLDLVDVILRAARQSGKPFGGVQVIFCGDFFQLPPIARDFGNPATFAFHSAAWSELNPTVCYLSGQYRHKDETLLDILNAIRASAVQPHHKVLLSERISKTASGSAETTKLFTHNADVDRLNEKELEKLLSQSHEYEMTSRGAGRLVEAIKRSCLAPAKLVLKKGARVMFVKNNFEVGYVNGTLGTIIAFSHTGPIVQTLLGKNITVEPSDWRIEEEGKVKASISQLPLRLAWAITVHKSQGMSLDAVEIDLTRCFEPGMGYVALSRVRSLEGLTLRGINDMAFAVHPEVKIIDRHFQESSEMAFEDFVALPAEEKERKQKDFRESLKEAGGKKTKGKKKSTVEITKEMLVAGKSVSAIAREREVTPDTILGHIETLLQAGEKLELGMVKKEFITDAQLENMQDAFEEVYKEVRSYPLGPTRERLGGKYTYIQLRVARLFLEKNSF